MEYTYTRKVKQYGIVKADSVGKLCIEVALMIGEGWEPVGGVAINGATFLQSMTIETTVVYTPDVSYDIRLTEQDKRPS